MAKEKMGSRELGLVLAQQLLGVDDLHYGLWQPDLPLSLANLAEAQQRYSDMLINDLPPLDQGEVRVFDIGCGTGHILEQMLKKGYRADGLVPAPALAEKVRERFDRLGASEARLYECGLQDMPDEECRNQYDVALFSESYQYINMGKSFAKLEKLVKPGGRVIICDFFKTEHDGDGQRGDGSFKGGHRLTNFYRQLEAAPFTIEEDTDITSMMSPNLELLNDTLMNKLAPAGATIGRYMQDNYPKLSWLAAKIFTKKFTKMKHKYFSGLRSKEIFERYKTYHHIVLRYTPES